MAVVGGPPTDDKPAVTLFSRCRWSSPAARCTCASPTFKPYTSSSARAGSTCSPRRSPATARSVTIREDHARSRAHARATRSMGCPLLGSFSTFSCASPLKTPHSERRGGAFIESLPPVANGTTETAFLIPLTFGARPAWCRNVLAEGECEITLGGVEYLARDAEIVDDLGIRRDIDTASNRIQRFSWQRRQ